ncbi:MAG: phospholipase A, partial [Pacificimonas sp.]
MRFMIPVLLAGSALLVGSPLCAAEIVVTPAAERGEDGRTVATLIFLNDGPDVLTPPATLEAVVAQDGVDMPVVLTREAGGDAIAAGGYAKQRYAFVPPESVSPAKPIQLRIAGDMAVTASLVLARPATLARNTATEEEMAPAEVQLATTPPDSRAEPEALAEASADGNLNFSTYRPMYALLGTSPLNAKLQFSFKYALVDPDGDAASDFSFLRGIYFGFTQTMFWDLGEDSSPFRSIDFQPELFYRYRSDLDIAAIEGSDINVQAGVRHYSNGRGDPDPALTGVEDPMGPDQTDSRSFNTVYLEPSLSIP